MAKRKKPISKAKRGVKKNRIRNFFKSQQTHLVFGVLVFSSAIFLLISFYSFLQHWKEDQSILNDIGDKSLEAKNLLGKLGASLSDYLVYDGFGVATFLVPILLFFTGLYIILHIPVKQLFKPWVHGLLIMIWLSLTFAHFKPETPILGGKVGYEINDFLKIYLGEVGVLILLILSLFTFLIVRFKVTPQKIKSWIPKPKVKKASVPGIDEDITDEGFVAGTAYESTQDEIELKFDSFETVTGEKIKNTDSETEEVIESAEAASVHLSTDSSSLTEKDAKADEEEIEIEVEQPVFEEHTIKNLSNTLVQDFGEFDPKLELSKFKFPELSLLKDYSNENIQINKTELENNKDRISS